MKNKRMKKNRRKFKNIIRIAVIDDVANGYSAKSLKSTMKNLQVVNKNAISKKRWRAKDKQCAKHAKSTLYKEVKKF